MHDLHLRFVKNVIFFVNVRTWPVYLKQQTKKIKKKEKIQLIHRHVLLIVLISRYLFCTPLITTNMFKNPSFYLQQLVQSRLNIFSLVNNKYFQLNSNYCEVSKFDIVSGFFNYYLWKKAANKLFWRVVYACTENRKQIFWSNSQYSPWLCCYTNKNMILNDDSKNFWFEILLKTFQLWSNSTELYCFNSL